MAKFHSFAEMTSLDAKQNNDRAFGAKSESEFRLTSGFNITANVKAFAVATGQVVLQEVNATDDSLGELVNLILKPTEEPEVGFSKVKYFIYRGLRKLDFVNASGAVLATGSQFITRINAEQAKRRQSKPTVGLIPRASLFGAAGLPATTILDELFFTRSNDGLHIMKIGEFIGNFEASVAGREIGFEIILENAFHYPTLEEARLLVNKITDASGDTIDKRAKRERVLHYMDPAAFYGLHCHLNKPVGNKTNPAVAYDPATHDLTTAQPVFESIINVFHTKSRVYVDVRNDNGYSLNFYNNYSGEAPDATKEIRKGVNTPAMTADKYYNTFKWPFYIIDDPANTTTDENAILLNLPLNDNKKPLVYLEAGKITSGTDTGNFIGENTLVGASTVWTNNIAFSNLNLRNAAPSTKSVATIIKLRFIRQINALSAQPGSVVRTNFYRDNLLGPLESILNWDTTSATKWGINFHKKYVDGTNEIELSYFAESAITAFPNTNSITVANDITEKFFSSEFEITSGVNAGTYSAREINTVAGSSQIQTWQTMPGTTVTGNVRFTKRTTATIEIPSKKITIHDADLSTEPGLSATKTITINSLTGKSFQNTINSITFANGNTVIVLVDDIPESGFGYMAQTGLALQSQRAVFYAFPVEYYKKGVNERMSVTTTLVAGTDNRQSMSQILKSFIPGTEFIKADLRPRPAPPAALSVLTYAEKSAGRENLLALGLTNGELTTLKTAAGSGLAGFHTKFIRLKNPTGIKVNLNFENYREYHLVAVGVDASGNEAEANPGITVFSRDGFLFCSEDFAEISLAGAEDPEHETVEEKKRTEANNLALLNSDTEVKAIVTDFETAVQAVPANGFAVIEQLVKEKGLLLFNTACDNIKQAGVTKYKDGILYYARLHMLVALKNCPALKKNETQRAKYVTLFERVSRGMTTVNFKNIGTKIPVLVAGFDPFQSAQSNPSGAIALGLHGKEITNGTKTALVQSVIFPVRYRDFDEGKDAKPSPKPNTGLVEEFFEKFIAVNADSIPFQDAVNPVRMILSLSLGIYENSRHAQNPLVEFKTAFHLEQYAVKNRRTLGEDNEKRTFPSDGMSNGPTGGETFYTTGLPYVHICSPALYNGLAGKFNQLSVYRVVNASGAKQAGTLDYYETTLNKQQTSLLESHAVLTAIPNNATGTLAATQYNHELGKLTGTLNYAISAFNPFGETIIAGFPAVVLAAPNNAVKLSWTRVPGAVGYKIYQKDPADSTFKRVATLGGLYIIQTALHNKYKFYKIDHLNNRPLAQGVLKFDSIADLTRLMMAATAFVPTLAADGLTSEFIDIGFERNAETPPASNTTAPPAAGLKIEGLFGSGGFFLSNEIYYRIAQLREQKKPPNRPPLFTGHLHVNDWTMQQREQFNMFQVFEDVIHRALDGI
jgi:hypothetical protein